MYSYILLPNAYAELINSWEWYEKKQIGLGDRFREEVGHTIQYILDHPYYFQLKHKNYREATTRIFPFLLVYVINEDKNLVLITAIFIVAETHYKKGKRHFPLFNIKSGLVNL